MTAQVRIWVVTDDFDPRGITETEQAAIVPEPRWSAENEATAEHIVLGYN
ncbi:hypothetical protein [Amycolatopsis coloradensis]|nr:hypothetical protein [Amycolatopsis coloradensis]